MTYQSDEREDKHVRIPPPYFWGISYYTYFLALVKVYKLFLLYSICILVDYFAWAQPFLRMIFGIRTCLQPPLSSIL